MNQTAIVSGNVTFECPIVSDIATFITWAKYQAFHDNDTNINFVTQLNEIRIKV